MERIQNVLQSAGIAVSGQQLEQLNDYYQMVIETNQVMNLTAITEKEEFILLHYLDSLAPLYAAPELKPLFGIPGKESVRMIDVNDVSVSASPSGLDHRSAGGCIYRCSDRCSPVYAFVEA